jgi:valyl-tRNA synthetase
VIEPQIMDQWFVGVDKEIPGRGGKTLKDLMMGVVDDHKIAFIPDRFEGIYVHWIRNLRDWCISRQIWYGHRIPVWYRGDEIYCGLEAPEGDGWKQDTDTLDTWFSSGLWTFSTLGWPDKKEFEANRRYHPTTVLETGADIIFFWVARMILMSTYILDEVPFETVYMHGLVRDTKNRKISKSLGNNIDPLDMIAKYGSDSVRMSLIVGVGPGNDSKIDESKIKAYKLFTNKIWNVARFVLSAADGDRGKDREKASRVGYDAGFSSWAKADEAHLARLKELTAELTREMDEYKFYLVGEKLYHYVWHEFADKTIEESKPILAGDDEKARVSRTQFLLHALTAIMKLLHPFMPYVTEEIWSDMPIGQKDLLIVEKWPG